MKKRVKYVQVSISLEYDIDRTYLLVTEYNMDKPIISFTVKMPYWDFEELLDVFPNYPLNFN